MIQDDHFHQVGLHWTCRATMFFVTFKAELSQLIPIQLDLPFLSLGSIPVWINLDFSSPFSTRISCKNHLFMMSSPFFGATPWPPPWPQFFTTVTRRSNSSRAAAIRRRASARAAWARLGRGPGGPGPGPGTRRAGSSEPRLGMWTGKKTCFFGKSCTNGVTAGSLIHTLSHAHPRLSHAHHRSFPHPWFLVYPTGDKQRFKLMLKKNICPLCSSGWWYTYPLKNMSSSVGMMKFPIYGKS